MKETPNQKQNGTTTAQQKEALRYFRDYAEDWRKKASSTDERQVNVIQQRNGYVLDVIKNREVTRTALDVGCGTGDLVCDIARRGIESTGVDFAREMINAARAKAKKARLGQTQFHCCSIFDFTAGSKKYDTISANGFIEYISLDELNRFLGLAHKLLRAGGSLVLGSRNRLFNLFSINSFTTAEVENGSASLLLREAVAVASEISVSELVKIKTAPLQSSSIRHAKTGVDVATRFQFTPVQLTKILKSNCFVVKELHPIHIHGVPSSFKERYPKVHTNISHLLQSHAKDCITLVPYASSFMVHAQRTV